MEDYDIRTLVTEFGTKLQFVSLAAPTDLRRAAMEVHFGQFVAPELIQAWAPEGTEALGRYSSSPRPDRIDIVEVRHAGTNYVVEANVIEVASTPEGDEQPAVVYPVTLSLEKRQGEWKIVKMEKGAYSELPQRRSIVGFWECLPPKNPSLPTTGECALGIAVDQSDGHYAVDTRLMAAIVNIPMGAKVRVSGVVTPATHLSSIPKYDIDGIISATAIERL